MNSKLHKLTSIDVPVINFTNCFSGH